MDLGRLWTSWGSLALVLTSTVGIYVVVVLYTRLAGARSLATMSSFDFAATVAIGSTVATAANLGTPLIHGVASLAVLYLAQRAAARIRRRDRLGRTLDNDPLLVYDDDGIIEANLRAGHVVEAELWAAVRRAGINRPEEIRAIVLETTGDLSVVHGELLDDRILTGVRRHRPREEGRPHPQRRP